MKQSLQEKKMKRISELLYMNLSYISGKREAGPNGAKEEFLKISAAFLRQLGKDVGFTEMKINKNPAGIACSGEISIYGMWTKGNGVFFEISQNVCNGRRLLYREIESLNDYKGKANKWLPLDLFEKTDYDGLCGLFKELIQKEEMKNAA